MSGYVVAVVMLAVVAWLLVGVRRQWHWSRFLCNLVTEGVQAAMERLESSRDSDAYLMSEEMGGKRFVQFRREVTEAGVLLTCYFPYSAWSMEYIEPLRRLLTARKMTFSERQDSSSPGVTGFTVIERLYADDAANFTDAVFREVLATKR